MDSEFSFEYILQSPQENTMREEEEERSIQRESTYKRKLEELLWRPFVDYEDETMAAQIQSPSRIPSRSNPSPGWSHSEQEQLAAPSHLECQPSSTSSRTPPTGPNISSGPSNQTIFGRKSVEPPSKSPPQQLQPSNYFSLNNQLVHFYCEICQVPCSGSLNYHNHLTGKKHKIKFQELKFGWKDEVDDNCISENSKKPWIRCEKCDIWCIDDNALQQHFAGKKHKKMDKKLEMVELEGDMGEDLECSLCGIGCSSKELLQLHLNGKKHRAELQKQAAAGNGRAEGCNRVPMKCKVCSTWCMDRSSLQIHLREKKHFMNGLEVKKKHWLDMIRDHEANN